MQLPWSAATFQPWAAAVLAEFGPDRVMFGSDWPVCRLAGAQHAVLPDCTQFC